MTCGRKPTVLTDDDVAEILLSGETRGQVAIRIGCSVSMIDTIRKRESKRAIRIALGLGLIKPRARRCWGPDGREQIAAAYVVKVKAGVNIKHRERVAR